MGLLSGRDWRGARWITDKDLLDQERAALGYKSEDTDDPNEVKWVQIDLGQVLPVDRVRLHALRHTVPERLGFPRRFRVEVANDPAMQDARVVSDQTGRDSNVWTSLIEVRPAGPVSGRYVRVTATRLRTTQGQTCLALSQIEVLSDGDNVAVGRKVTASDSVEKTPWSAAAVVDGLGVPKANPHANRGLRMRRAFDVRPGLCRAVVHVCGLGHYEMSMNSSRVGEGLLTPGWTAYDKTCLYDTHEVTSLLRPGSNAVGLTLACGMYNVQAGRYVKFIGPFRPLTAIGLIRLDYEDGTTETVVTDDAWKVSAGPITFSNVFGGEDYDARLEQPGWDGPGFDAAGWAQAATYAGPGGKLEGATRASPPLRAFEVLKPVAHRPIRPGVEVYDLGQNASIMIRMRVRGPAGSTVKVIPAELVRADGSVDRGSCGGGEASWNYTLAGRQGPESWEPRFFYHGSRYLQVERRAPGGGGDLPELESIEGLVAHSDCPPAGEFTCSSDLFNRIRMLVRWAQKSNLAHVLTDCPHRERLGWLEQVHLNGPALRYEWDLDRLFSKTFGDMADAQQPSGLVPDIAPEYIVFDEGFRDSPEWGSAVILAAWQHSLWTGDDSPLQRHYPVMQQYLAYLASRAQDHIVSHGLGDWYDIGPNPSGNAQLTPVALTATAIYFEDVQAMARIAEHLGRTEDARRYTDTAGEIKAAFNRRFFNPETGVYATGSQTAQAMPLVLGLVEPDRRAGVLDALVRDIRDRGNAITAGDVGYRYVLRALADAGRSDVVFDMNHQADRPGYGYQLAQGATSLTEAWNADRRSSQNHFMLGQIQEWFYHDLAGIQPDPAGPGFRTIVIRPAMVQGLTWVQASYESPYGRVSSAWRREAEGLLSLDVTVPVNARATLHIPATDPAAVSEGGGPADQAPGVRFLRRAEGRVIYELGSGVYAFSVRP